MNNVLKNKIIAVDFDGTLCVEEYPDIGPAKTEVIEYVKSLQKNGCRLILWTCREGELLNNAVAWCKEHNLHFDAVNQNLVEEQEKWGNDCRKVGANYFLDDRNLHIPGSDNWLLLRTDHIFHYATSSHYNNAKVFSSENIACEHMLSEVSELLESNETSDYIKRIYEGSLKHNDGLSYVLGNYCINFRENTISMTDNRTGNRHIFKIMKCEVNV